MTARVVVTATTEGSEVDRFELAHGHDPAADLAERGWVVAHPVAITTDAEPEWVVTIRYAVRPSTPTADTAAGDVGTPRDGGLTDAEVERAVVRQRVAAYALVTSDRGLLATELSGVTNAAGRWNLPGGGVDRGEDVAAALAREVWEESDQRIADVELFDVRSRHWVGRAPDGVVEDYHAVQLFHTARCRHPTDPRINDVGGSTSDVAWVPLDVTDRVPWVESLRPLIRAFLDRHPVRD